MIFVFFIFGAEHMDPLNIKIAELREALESITTEQKYLKARDARHRYSKPHLPLCKLSLSQI